MKTTDHQPMPGDTPVCLDPRHGVPCFGECSACDEECDPRFRSTLENADRRAELDSELKAMGAVVIQVKDLGAALEARHYGAMAIQSMTDPDLDATGPDDYPEWAADVAGEWASDAAHLGRLALGEVGCEKGRRT